MLGIPDYEPEMRKATKALKERLGVRHAAKGAFLLEGRPFGCVRPALDLQPRTERRAAEKRTKKVALHS